MNKFIPKDNEYYRKIYEPKGKGICGISVLAVLLKKSCKEILDEFGDYKGHMPHKDIRRFLEEHNFKVKQKRGNRSKEIDLPKNKKAICSVQYIGKDNGKYHGFKCWSEASKHTHFILIDNDLIFCNANGWIPREELKLYLKEAYITSYLEVENGRL